MTYQRIIAATLAWFLSLGFLQAQFASSLKIEKKEHLIGEAVMAILTITNHTGEDQIFQNNDRFPWLSLMVKTMNGESINPKHESDFGPIKIAAGQTLARKINIANYFHLTRPGNFAVSAIITPSNQQIEGSSTNRIFFNQNPGRVIWTQKVGGSSGIPQKREYRLINFTGDRSTQLYVQIENTSTGQLACTYPIGESLLIRKPIATVDRQQNMHAMFLSTPTMWLHYVINLDGKVMSRKIHKRGATGDPKLVTLADGTVEVSNSIAYDPDEIAKRRSQIRNITDRP